MLISFISIIFVTLLSPLQAHTQPNASWQEFKTLQAIKDAEHVTDQLTLNKDQKEKLQSCLDRDCQACQALVQELQRKKAKDAALIQEAALNGKKLMIIVQQSTLPEEEKQSVSLAIKQQALLFEQALDKIIPENYDLCSYAVNDTWFLLFKRKNPCVLREYSGIDWDLDKAYKYYMPQYRLCLIQTPDKQVAALAVERNHYGGSHFEMLDKNTIRAQEVYLYWDDPDHKRYLNIHDLYLFYRTLHTVFGNKCAEEFSYGGAFGEPTIQDATNNLSTIQITGVVLTLNQIFKNNVWNGSLDHNSTRQESNLKLLCTRNGSFAEILTAIHQKKIDQLIKALEIIITELKNETNNTELKPLSGGLVTP